MRYKGRLLSEWELDSSGFSYGLLFDQVDTMFVWRKDPDEWETLSERAKLFMIAHYRTKRQMATLEAQEMKRGRGVL